MALQSDKAKRSVVIEFGLVGTLGVQALHCLVSGKQLANKGDIDEAPLTHERRGGKLFFFFKRR